MRKNGLENLILKGRITLREGLVDKKIKQINLRVRPKTDDKYSEGIRKMWRAIITHVLRGQGI